MAGGARQWWFYSFYRDLQCADMGIWLPHFVILFVILSGAARIMILFIELSIIHDITKA